MTHLNTAADISAFAQTVQEQAMLVERNMRFMSNLVTVYSDKTGINSRSSHQYNAGTAKAIGEADDLTSDAFTPSVLSTITPSEIGEQFLVTDLRAETDDIESIMDDASMELGLAATDKVESDLLGLFSSFTGGTIGASGTTPTWGHIMAAISICRVQVKSQVMPLSVVLHEYQWQPLAKASSIAAGTSISQSPAFTDETMMSYYRGTVFGNVDIYVTGNSGMLSSTNAYGAVFAKDALALDWRRYIRVEAERDTSRRGTELNMSAVYAKGVWRPTHGVTIYTAASAPTA